MTQRLLFWLACKRLKLPIRYDQSSCALRPIKMLKAYCIVKTGQLRRAIKIHETLTSPKFLNDNNRNAFCKHANPLDQK